MKTYLINLLLVFISTLVALGFAEVALRITGVDPNTDTLTTYEFDETVGWVTRKDFKYYRSTLYFAHFNYFDSYGFPTRANGMGRELSVTAPSIAIIGDSFAEGYYVPYDDSIAGTLEQMDQGLQVVNAGVGGHSPDQTYLHTKSVLNDFSVQKVAVLFFPANDISAVHSTTYQGYQKPYFEDPYGEPVNVPIEFKSRDEKETSLIENLVHNSALYAVLRPLVRSKISWKLIHDSQQAAEVYESEKMKKALSFYDRIKKENPDVELKVYFVPQMEGVMDEQAYQQNSAVFLSVCEELELSCELITFPEGADPQEYYILGDGHFSTLGTTYVAELINRTFLE